MPREDGRERECPRKESRFRLGLNRHYTDTFEAMNRMRSQLSRKSVDIDKLAVTRPVGNWP